MISVIIVEDERVIRNGINKHVQWGKLGITDVRIAENGDEAFSISEEFKPDIIISDIRMPGMNGIELCTKFRELFPESQIIFISGFSDKEYLMAGISLGAISYVEKPIDIEELTKSIEKAVKAVHRTKRQNTNVLRSLLWTSDSQEIDTKKIHSDTEFGRKLSLDTVFYISVLDTKNEIKDVLGFTNKCNELLRTKFKEVQFIADSIGNNKIAILVFAETAKQVMDDNFKAAMSQIVLSLNEVNELCFLGIGKNVNSLKLLPESYQSALEGLKSLSYKGWNNYSFFYEERWESDYLIEEKEKNRFYKTLALKKEAEAFLILEKIYDKLIEKHAVLNFHVRNIYFTLDNIVTQIDKVQHLNGFSQGEVVNAQFLDQAKTICEMHEYVCQHIKEVLEETEEDKKNNFMIQCVIDYINQNLDNKSLCIAMLADEVFLTPTYLSNLFKKKTGMTIGQYLTEVRMKKAEELLKNPQLKLYQVGEMVGYRDANYFAKIFKKQTGMLPSEYREIR